MVAIGALHSALVVAVVKVFSWVESSRTAVGRRLCDRRLLRSRILVEFDSWSIHVEKDLFYRKSNHRLVVVGRDLDFFHGYLDRDVCLPSRSGPSEHLAHRLWDAQ